MDKVTMRSSHETHAASRDEAVEDRRLLQLVAHGDQRALEDLYARYRVRLWRYLWYRLDGNASRVEELHQEVFLAVWRSAHTYRGEAQVDTWITRIAHHHVLNAQRSQARRPEGHLLRHEEGLQHEQVETHIAGYASYEDQVLDRLLLADALQQLSKEHREILELAFSYGFSCNEMAQILNIPVGTVKSRISYARRKLLTELEIAKSKGGG